MAYTTINKSSLHYNTKLYTGTGSSNAITGVFKYRHIYAAIECIGVKTE